MAFQIGHAQGPNAPEAAGFEPVDATDMVNLTNGDFTYVLPLMSVEGFPVSLSYHAGMTTDMDASWVGLGWYLNPGAINRSVTNTPDDWKGGVGINFNSFEREDTYYGVTVDVGFPAGASVGVGLNWGGGQGLSGSVRASYGFSLGDMVKGGASISASTTGDVSAGVSAGVQLGSIQAGASLSYSLSAQKFTLGVGVGLKDKAQGPKGFENSSLGLGGSLTEGGSFSVGAGTNHSGGKRSEGGKGSASGGVGMGSASFSQGDASVDVQSTAVAIPLHFVGIPVTLGFSKTKVKINIKKGYNNEEWGALYASDFSGYTSGGSAQIRNSRISNYDGYYYDYVVRTKSLDVYSTRLPQSEEDFISDYSKTIENVNFTYMGYDSYNVAAQGLMGNLTPRVFQSATIFGKGTRTQDEDGDAIHAFWHHGTPGQSVDRELGRLNGENDSYNSHDLYFYFDGQFTSRELDNGATIKSSYYVNNSNDMSDFISPSTHSGSATSSATYGRAKSPNFVEVFTNQQIYDGHAATRGLISPATILNSDRVNVAKFDPNGIGAYKVTSPDGKTYHFSLPVYHYEQIHRSQIDQQENDQFDIGNVNEKRQYSRYATHWLLTAITGSDYIDRPDPNNRNRSNTFNKEDYGYWVELEYGKWSDGYVWRTPYKDRTYNYNTNLKNNIETSDKGGYSFGRKQLYYLDKINTANRTALFIKEIRYDAIGKDLQFKFKNGYSINLGSTGEDDHILNKTDGYIDVMETNVHYNREYSLKLSKIILVKSEVGKNLDKSGFSTTTMGGHYPNYTANETIDPGWRSEDFKQIYWPNNGRTRYRYTIHNEANILGSNDLPDNFVEDHALQVIELNHDYELAKLSDSSSDAPNGSPNGIINGRTINGRLTLRSVQVKGKSGATFIPPTTFSYYMENFNNIPTIVPSGGINPSPYQIEQHVIAKKELVDSWGYLQGTHSGDNKIKAWSLKSIHTPTGATIEVDYEEDDYWTEAFARRYWQNDLLFQFFDVGNSIEIWFSNDDPSNNLGLERVDFQDYFIQDVPFFADLWFCIRNEWRGGVIRECRSDRGHIDINGREIIPFSVTSNTVKFLIPKNEVIGGNGGEIDNIYGNNPVSKTYHPYVDEYQQKNRGLCPSDIPNECKRDSFTLTYKILANKVPEDETGGGLRVKELRTVDGSNTYKAQYDYSHPTEHRSSGITSYAPIDGLKYVPYQTEIPGPGVMYEYVTMKEASNSGDYYSKTRYRHHVLKPVFNIFNPNIEMEALDADAVGEDQIFWATVTDNYGGLNGTNSRKIEAKKINVNINSALIGQIKSIENINSYDQVMMRTENEYINGAILTGERRDNHGTFNNREPAKGFVRESFNSMKSIFKTNDDGNQILGVKRLLSISTKTEYNNMLKTTTSIGSGQKVSIEYSDIDPWLSSFRKSETTLANGVKKVSYRVPAYEKYAALRSKVLNPNNKNMLTQQAMSIDEYGGKTLNASLTTWNNDWSYLDSEGNIEANPRDGIAQQSWVWRKHKTFVWKDDVNASTGTYATTISPTSDYFNWGTGTPTNTKWQNISEITKYTHWSSPLETRDINNNFAASKMTDNFSKVIATGNARETELFYSGAEYNPSGNYTEGAILGANYRSQDAAHTGTWSLKTTSSTDKLFEINKSVSSSLSTNSMRPGDYRVSYWIKDPQTRGVTYSRSHLMVNGAEVPVSETETAGCWKQFNYTISIPDTATTVNIYVKNDNPNVHYDDFRMHPIYASMSSYVYNQDSDELIAILGANNMASVFCYDNAGRLCASYVEAVAQGYEFGGFKISSENRYKYQGLQTNNIACECNVSCIYTPVLDEP